MKQVHIFVYGRVQGVGFRQFVRHHAKKLRVVGWVRNNPDGSVEALLQGAEVAVRQLVRLCKKGPFLSEVKKVEVIEEEIKELLPSFQVTN